MQTLLNLVADLGQPQYRKYTVAVATDVVSLVAMATPVLPDKWKPIALAVVLLANALGIKAIANDPMPPAAVK